jgi:hypothetical protein
MSVVNRAAQKGVFHFEIQIADPLFIDVCAAGAAETGLNSRNIEKQNKRCLSVPIHYSMLMWRSTVPNRYARSKLIFILNSIQAEQRVKKIVSSHAWFVVPVREC